MRVLISSICVALWSSAAVAAGTGAGGDATPTSYDWSGPYAGVQIGYGFAQDSDYETNLVGTFPVSYDYHPKGVIGGLHVGYNFQDNRIVWGAEADINGSNLSATQYVPAYGVTYTSNTTSHFGATLLGRLGYTFDRFMVYATGGLAYGKVTTQYNCLGCVALASGLGSIDASRFGWAAGVGSEYRISDRTSIRLEYLYTDLGSKSASFPSPIVAWYQRNRFTSGAVSLGVSYHF